MIQRKSFMRAIIKRNMERQVSAIQVPGSPR